MADRSSEVEMEEKKGSKTVPKKNKKTAGGSASAKTDPKKTTTPGNPGDHNPRMSVDSIRYENEDEERAAALKAFQQFDEDGSGTIDINELRDLCSAVGRPVTKKELMDAIAILDKDKNGTIDFEEFYAWFSNKLTGTATPRHMMLADVRRKMRRYTTSNLLVDTLGPAIGIVVPTDWSWSRMVHESQSVWARMTAGTVFESSKKKRVRAIFNKYDTDKSGELDIQEFDIFCRDLGEHYTHEQLEVALAEMDEDGNGTIDFEEFYRWWCADPAHSKDADFANRMRNTVYGYRDTEPMEEAANDSFEKRSLAGGTGDPGLVAENRRLKAELAAMQAQLDALSHNHGSGVRHAADDSSDSFEALDRAPTTESDSDDGSQKPNDQAPRKKKGKRKSRKPQKLEDSDDYETSEDQGTKIRAASKA